MDKPNLKMVEIYKYIERLPKTFEDVFRSEGNLCRIERFGCAWYFGVGDIINFTDRYEYLIESVKAIEVKTNRITDKNVIRRIIDNCQLVVVQQLLQIVDHLFTGHLNHQIQYSPFIASQIDDGVGRIYWRVFHTLGFRNIKDQDFLNIISNPLLLRWAIRNITKDAEEEFEKWKTLQFFINPEMYRDIYKSGELAKDMEEKIKLLTERAKQKMDKMKIGA